MTFLIAAAGTGGHVFPGLAVGEALVGAGVSKDDVLFVGGSRLEASIYPDQGFRFIQVELRGLQRSLTLKNLALPRVVMRAKDDISDAIGRHGVKVALGMGGYVTVPTAMAARREGISLMISEQNAGAGLANRMVQRWATRRFTSFPDTHGLPGGEWVGNPIRAGFSRFDRTNLRSGALRRYSFSDAVPVLGVFGGSLGAGAINTAVAELVRRWRGRPVQVLHVTGERNLEEIKTLPDGDVARWNRIAFEDEMELFYAACDLVVARAGGAVAELTATATPSILVPGGFGSSGHQAANAAFLEKAGASVVVQEDQLDSLDGVVADLIHDTDRLAKMASAALGIARPEAAPVIAKAMMDEAR